MYDLAQVKKDYPWTLIDDDMGWFEMGIPDGWGDIVNHGLALIDAELKIHPEYRLVIEQIKEKWGELRFYFLLEKDGETVYADDDVHETIDYIINQMTQATRDTCCYCGSRENISCRGGGWVHYSCDTCHEKTYGGTLR